MSLERERERNFNNNIMMKPTIWKSQEEDHKGEKEENSTEDLAIWDCGSPLYDSYELVSLSHLIERHLMILPSLGGSKRFITTQFSSRSIDVDRPMNMSNVSATKLAKGSSMVARLSGLLERKIMWKRKVFGERRENPKKMKKLDSILRLFRGQGNKVGTGNEI